MLRQLYVLPLLSVGAFVTPFASEATAGQLDGPDTDPLIYDGEDVDTCNWASVPAFNTAQYGCTAVLIHPQVAVTHAFCAYQQDYRSALFGEDASAPAHKVFFEECWIPDAYDPSSLELSPAKIAFCKFPAPIDLPYTPPAFGCELEQLSAPAEVAVVGFGRRFEDVQAGPKIWKSTQLLSNYQTDPFALLGNPDPVMCRGDAGAPALIQLPDGSWRVFGIGVNGASPCGTPTPSEFIWLHEWIPWAEEQTGIDLTPCHDADGSWNPSPLCQGFVVDPFDPGNGDWDQWCAGAPVSAPGTSCGPAMEPDIDPPNVSITAPADQSYFEGPIAQVDIVVEADDGSWPVDSIELFIDGESITLDDEAPWAFNLLGFPEGSWTLVVRAVDLSGNVGESAPIEIHVGQMPPETGETGETSGTGGTDETGGPGFEGEDTGCGCTADRDAGRATSVLVFALLLLGRRRTTRSTNIGR